MHMIWQGICSTRKRSVTTDRLMKYIPNSANILHSTNFMKNNLVDEDHNKNEQETASSDNDPSESPTTPTEAEAKNPIAQVLETANIVSVVDLQQALSKAQEDLAVANEKCLRIHAEFDNFRRRTAQERMALIDMASKKLLEQFLPLLDDFERALSAVNEEQTSIASVAKGIQLIYEKMIQFLAQANVLPMPIEEGSIFNPELHEAISKTAVSDQSLQHKIIHVATKGYMLKDKVLRYAKVIIGE